jgi:hypothetical protein
VLRKCGRWRRDGGPEKQQSKERVTHIQLCPATLLAAIANPAVVRRTDDGSP